MTEERDLKRIRQACQNCRRKKTRCSGEKPVCAFCARLKQPCNYDNGALPADGPVSDLTLATRVALLESKLSLMSNVNTDFAATFDDEGQRGDGRKSISSASQHHRSFSASERDMEFAVLPPPAVIQSLTDTYFRYCHDQPYCYFVEADLRLRLEAGELPSYLVMAIIAMAARFSNEHFFEGKQVKAIEAYSRTAWAAIFEKSFSEDDAMDISVVQATNLLAVVDFTSGKHKLAWVKIGLSVRFAQSLQLTQKPPEDLSPEQQEERIVTFWSVYLLDRLVSCGNNRPPTIADSDCSVRLPLTNTASATDLDLDSITLHSLQDSLPDSEITERLSDFAHVILMASTLAQVGRFARQHHDSNNTLPPWHSSSDYTRIYSLLMTFETFSISTGVPFSEALTRWYTNHDLIDQQSAGHFIFSVILSHMNQCLLHHPFLLRHRLHFSKAKVPPSFFKDALRRAREHAQLLTMVLHVVQKKALTLASFYSYACTVAGTIHKLFMYHDDQQISNVAEKLFEFSVEFLNHGLNIWEHYPRMASSLLQFDPDPISAKSLVTGSATAMSPSEWLKDPEIDVIWNMLDYGWLSDPARPASASGNTTLPHTGTWDTPFLQCQNDPVMQGMDNFITYASTGQPNAPGDPQRESIQDTWSDILERDQTFVPVGSDAEQDWLDLMI